VTFKDLKKRVTLEMLISARANGSGVPREGGGMPSSRITIFSGKLMKGTFDASAQTAHTNLPPGIRAWKMWLKVVL
jgi:hypothetical protein